MDAFRPEFSAYWSALREQLAERRSGVAVPADQGLSPAQQAALEELVERVNAARSVV